MARTDGGPIEYNVQVKLMILDCILTEKTEEIERNGWMLYEGEGKGEEETDGGGSNICGQEQLSLIRLL